MQIAAGKRTDTTVIRLFVAELLNIMLHPSLQSYQREVRDGRGPKEHKRLFLRSIDKIDDFLIHQVGNIFPFPAFGIAFLISRIGSLVQLRIGERTQRIGEILATLITIEERWKLAVRLLLVVVTIEEVEAYFVRCTHRFRIVQSPLSDTGGNVALLFLEQPVLWVCAPEGDGPSNVESFNIASWSHTL